MALVIFVGEAVQKKFNTDKELTRKCEHIATSASWAICYFFVGTSIHIVIINLLAFIALAAITFTGFMSSAERTDAKRSYGLFYFGLSTLITITLTIAINPNFIAFSGIAYYCLALGDGLAPIVARFAGRHNIGLFAPKTLVGFLTVFAVCSLVAWLFSAIFSLELSPLFIISLGSLAAHAEIYGKGGADNLTLNFSVFGYLVLNFYGLVEFPLMLALVILPVFTVLAAVSNALTHNGALISFVYILISGFFGSLAMVLMIFILFFAEAIISRISSKKATAKTRFSKEKHARGSAQILANTMVAMLCLVLYYFLRLDILLFVAAAAVAEEFADSIASAIGRLSSSKPIDIVRFKSVEPGVSGGVSVIGLIGALLASFAAATIPLGIDKVGVTAFIVIGAVAFFGTVIDSVLGSLFQGLFRCPTCDMLTEQARHCDADAQLIKGARIINNATVNFISSALTAAIAAGVLVIFI